MDPGAPNFFDALRQQMERNVGAENPFRDEIDDILDAAQVNVEQGPEAPVDPAFQAFAGAIDRIRGGNAEAGDVGGFMNSLMSGLKNALSAVKVDGPPPPLTLTRILSAELFIHSVLRDQRRLPLISLGDLPPTPEGVIHDKIRASGISGTEDDNLKFIIGPNEIYDPQNSLLPWGSKIFSSQHIRDKFLFADLPLLANLSYQGYRWAGFYMSEVFRVATNGLTVYNQNPQFYILASSVEEAKLIHRNFLLEVEQLAGKSNGRINVNSIVRDSNLTTIHLTIINDKGAARDRMLHIGHCYYENESILSGSFDFACDQIIFDGINVKLTPSAMFCWRSRIVPLDLTNLRPGWWKRLTRISQDSYFWVYAPGLEYHDVIETFRDHPWLNFNSRLTTDAVTFPGTDLNLGLGVYKEHFGIIPDFKISRGYGRINFKDGHLANELLSEKSLELLLDHEPIVIFSPNVSEFLDNQMQAPEITLACERIFREVQNFQVPDFRRNFAYPNEDYLPDAGRAASLAVTENNKELQLLIKETIARIELHYNEQVVELKAGIVWTKFDSKGCRFSKGLDFYPKLKTPQGWKSLYNGFKLDFTISAKLTIMCAYKRVTEVNFGFRILPKDVVKHILNILDLLMVEELLGDLNLYFEDRVRVSEFQTTAEKRNMGNLLGSMFRAMQQRDVINLPPNNN